MYTDVHQSRVAETEDIAKAVHKNDSSARPGYPKQRQHVYAER